MKSIRSSIWCRKSPRLENINNDLSKRLSSYRGSIENTEASKVRIRCDKNSKSLKAPRLLVPIDKKEAQTNSVVSIQSVQREKEILQEFSDPRILAKLSSKIGLTGNILCKSIAHFFGNCKLLSLSDIEKCIIELKNGFYSKTPARPEKQMVNSNSYFNINLTSSLNLQTDKKEIDQPFKFGHNRIYLASSEPIETEFYDSEVDFLYSTPAELVKNDTKVLPGDDAIFNPVNLKDGMICSDNKDFEEYLKKNPDDKGTCVTTETSSILSILNSVDKSAVIIQKDCYITNRILDSLKKKDEREKVKDKENIEASMQEKEVNYILSRQGAVNLSDLLLLTDKNNASLIKKAMEKAKQTPNNFINESDINEMMTTTDKSIKIDAHYE